MNKTKPFIEEKIMIEIGENSRKEDYKLNSSIEARAFIQAILDFLELSDSLNGKIDKQIFFELYLSDEHIADTAVTNICKRLFIQERSMYRYRLKYVKLIDYMLKRHHVNFLSDKTCRKRA